MRRIEPQELNEERRRGGVSVLDVRSEPAFAAATEHLPGDVRYSPDRVDQWWSDLPRAQHLVTYCT